MAKQLVNPIERHIEKGVLAVAALVLLYAIVFFLVTTPNTLELGPDKVTPTTIDSRVAQKATDALERIRTAPAKIDAPEPLAPRFASTLTTVEKKPLPATVSLGVDVPMFDAASIVGKAQLAKVVPVPKPVYTKGRSTFEMSVGGQSQMVPVDWITISAPIDVKGQMDIFKKTYGATRTSVIYGTPEVQRRAQKPDGTWSDGDWQAITPWPAANMPREPKLEAVEEGSQAAADKEQLKAIDKYLKDLTDLTTQRSILRPLMGTPINGDQWRVPEIVGVAYRDVLLMDDEIMHPDDPPATNPEDLIGLGGVGAAKAEKALPKTEEQRLAQELETAQQMLEDAKKNGSLNDATEAYNRAFEVKQAKESSVSLKQRAEKFMKDAEQAMRDIQRVTAGGKPAVAPKVDAEKPKRLTRLAMQQLWAHDSASGSLKSGQTYQYRIRIRVFNHFAGMPEKLSNPQDAGVLFLTSDWSEPTDPITIEPSSYFFVTDGDKGKGEIRVEFYRWWDGVWVKAPIGFKASVGQPVAEIRRTTAPKFDNPNETDNPEVPYSAEAVVLDIDFERPVRERKSGTTPKGVRFGSPAPGTAVVLLASDGGLSERVVPVDKGHAQKRELDQRLYKPTKTSK